MGYLSKKYTGLSIGGRPHLHKENAQGWGFFLRNWDKEGLCLREFQLFFSAADTKILPHYLLRRVLMELTHINEVFSGLWS
jgi:hypothetical protein